MSTTFSTEGVVLKRVNYKEADRLVTIFTKNQGKITAIAKGVRHLKSRKKGSLEPASHAQFYFVNHRGWYILAQARLINSYPLLQTNLTRMTQTYQILEIINHLTTESTDQETVFTLLIQILNELSSHGLKKNYLLHHTLKILMHLGYAPQKTYSETELHQLLESVISYRLNSKRFLTPMFSKLQ